MKSRLQEIPRTNYHTHCDHCGHAVGKASDYAEEAVRKGLVSLGFSDHLPFAGDTYYARMPYAEMDEYLQEVAQLKEQYSARLKIYCGFEGEYLRGQTGYYESLLTGGRCDYLILGQHFFEAESGEMGYVYHMDNTAGYEDYSKSIVEAMKTGYFQFVAHPDIIFMNQYPWDLHCERACDILIEGAVKYGFPLEYNANGLRRGKHPFPEGERYLYPHERFWDKVKGTGVEVYVGSDCHDPRQVYDEYVLQAYETMERLGIPVKTELRIA